MCSVESRKRLQDGSVVQELIADKVYTVASSPRGKIRYYLFEENVAETGVDVYTGLFDATRTVAQRAAWGKIKSHELARVTTIFTHAPPFTVPVRHNKAPALLDVRHIPPAPRNHTLRSPRKR